MDEAILIPDRSSVRGDGHTQMVDIQTTECTSSTRHMGLTVV